MISVVFNHDKEKNHFNEGANHRPVDKVSSLQTRNKKTILNTYQLAPRKKYCAGRYFSTRKKLHPDRTVAESGFASLRWEFAI